MKNKKTLKEQKEDMNIEYLIPNKNAKHKPIKKNEN